ncbi:MAG: gliding motility-associated C-terminal domain-containing protein, partial [Bacteroidales bacterium]|nr:gliding motility-associated C-terminal domain-containing protein [Bacteroidales bacterium]
YLDDGSTDNCGISTMSLNRSVFDCSHVGLNTVSLIVSDASGNIDSCESTVTVYDTLAPRIIPPSDIVECAESETGNIVENIGMLTISDGCTDSADVTVTYIITGATNTSGTGDASGTLFAIDTSVVTYYAEDLYGNIDSCSFNVIIHAVPHDTINGPDTVACRSANIQYEVAYNPHSTYQWYAHDSITFVGPSDTNVVVVNFGDLDNVWISVVETNEFGCQDSVTMQIAQSGCGLRADFLALETVVCVGDTVHFVDLCENTTSITDYMWVFGDGVVGDTLSYVSMIDTVSYVYTTGGVKTVELWLIDGAADTMRIRTDYITVYPATEITSQPVDSIIECVGTPVSFSLTAVGESLTFTWEKFNGTDWNTVISDGNLTIVDDTLISIIADTSSYSGLYRCKVTGYCNTVISDTVYVLFHELPEPMIAVTNDSICAGDTVVFMAAGGDDYIFYLNGDTVLTGNNIYTTDTLINGDQVYAEVIDMATGCNAFSEVIMMEVFDLPVITAFTASNDSICEGVAVDFNVTATGGSIFDFYVNDELVQSGISAQYTTDSLTTGDIVYVVVRNSNTCEAISDSILLTVFSLPEVTLIDDVTIGTCTNDLHLVQSYTPSVTFSWTPDDGSLDLSNPEDAVLTNPNAGAITTYIATITDGNGCVGLDSVLVEVYDHLEFTNILASSVYCNTDYSGSIDITVDGGSGNYTYQWTAISGTGIDEDAEDQDGLSSGDYSVVVTDDNTGCDRDTSITIEETNPLIADASVTSSYQHGWHISYTGATDGIAEVMVNRDPSVYSVQWDDTLAQTTVIADSLGSGTYTVFVVDSFGCTASDTVTVLEPDGFNANIFVQNAVSCYGFTDGALIAQAYNNAGTVSYRWEDGSTDQILTGVGEGMYIVTVTDGATGEEFIDTTYLDQPGPLYVSIGIINPIKCAGDENGVLVAVLDSGGTQPASAWLWNSGNTNETYHGAAAGDYSVILWDANRCEGRASRTLTEPDSVKVDFVIADAKCNGDATGWIYANASGGYRPYTYEWFDSNGVEIPLSWQDSILQELPAGNYIGNVLDYNGCKVLDTLEVKEAHPIKITLHVEDPFCFSLINGFIAVDTITGGTPPYNEQFGEWNTGQIGDIISDLDTGYYQLTIRDINECVATVDTILAYQSDVCLMPYTGFTPNNDYQNDYWEILGAEYYPDIIVEVYDRWGKMVYKSKSDGYFNNMPDHRWNGESLKGKALPMDSYFYIITFKNSNAVFNGSVTLIR